MTLEERVALLEAQVRLLLKAGQGNDPAIVSALAKMTPKMHGALQIVLAGGSNADIAERFDVTESTAKVYVRSVALKVGVKTRSEIVGKVMKTFEQLTDQEYMEMSGGVPKTWGASGKGWTHGADE